MKLTDREWKEFKICDLFVMEKDKKQVPTGAYINKDNLRKGKTPRITVTSTNNGIDNYWTSTHKNYRCFDNFISVSFLGDSFYHKYRASLDMKVHCLKTKDIELNENIALFISSCLKNNTKNSSYGNQLSSTDLPLKSILLPINAKGKPDYQFMEDYIKEIMRTKRQEYINYARKILAGGGGNRKINQPLVDKNWKAFRITDIFLSIQRGKRLVKEKQIAGMVPYISSTAMNNGVDNFIQYDERSMRKYSNCLSIANSGSVGSTFYEPFAFVASDHITHLKNKDFTQNIYLFIATLGNRLSQKYNFNREINDSRISREKIMLPTDDSGHPYYEYMEQYIKNMMLAKYNDYLQYVSNLQYENIQTYLIH